ncbi:MAG: NAD(P)-dependent oxidoreductase [bacterium]
MTRYIISAILLFRVVPVLLILWSADPLSSFSATEIAPGVHFHVAREGGNLGWVEFESFILVIESGASIAARTVLDEIRSISPKPVRYVFHTQSGWDESWDDSPFAAEGATRICQRQDLDEAPSSIRSKESGLNTAEQNRKGPVWLFDDRLVIEEGARRVELLHFGPGLTRGGAVAWLPREQILFTGGLCVNGIPSVSDMTYTAKWLDVLTVLEQLGARIVCPGRGESGGNELLRAQKDFWTGLRAQVQEGLKNKLSLLQIEERIQSGKPLPESDLPLYREAVHHIYKELTGLIMPFTLAGLELRAGPSPTRDSPGWTPPRKILAQGLFEGQLPGLRLVAPGVEIVEARSEEEALKHMEGVDAVIGPVTPAMFRAAPRLRWVHIRTVGVEEYLFPELVDSPVVMTNSRGMSAAAIADQVLGFMLMFSKGLADQYEQQLQGKWIHVRNRPPFTLEEKTLLIWGFGGIGREVARRAAGFGMRIIAIDPKPGERPAGVQRIVPPGEMEALLPQADFVVCCVPLTPATQRYFNTERLAMMKPSAYLVNISRGEVIDTGALVDALRANRLAGAAMDVTDPEPLPEGHPLWSLKNVIITPHMSARAYETDRLAWHLLRENVRRFAAGEALLNVVDKKAGF